jgi:hypothetical protein
MQPDFSKLRLPQPLMRALGKQMSFGVNEYHKKSEI